MSEMQILQPKNCNFSDIKHNIVQTDEKIIDTATYPNGFILKTTQYAGEIKIWTNRPLVKVSDNVYQIPE